MARANRLPVVTHGGDFTAIADLGLIDLIQVPAALDSVPRSAPPDQGDAPAALCGGRRASLSRPSIAGTIA